jgi:hypothetical protein
MHKEKRLPFEITHTPHTQNESENLIRSSYHYKKNNDNNRGGIIMAVMML